MATAESRINEVIRALLHTAFLPFLRGKYPITNKRTTPIDLRKRMPRGKDLGDDLQALLTHRHARTAAVHDVAKIAFDVAGQIV